MGRKLSLLEWIMTNHSLDELKQMILRGADLFEMDRNGCVPYDFAEKDEDQELLMHEMVFQMYLAAQQDNIKVFSVAWDVLRERTDIDLYELTCDNVPFLEMIQSSPRVHAHLVDQEYIDE